MFKSKLQLPTENPSLIIKAIKNDDIECDNTNIEFSYKNNSLVVDIEASDIRFLHKAINSVVARFKLSYDTIELCNEEEKETIFNK